MNCVGTGIDCNRNKHHFLIHFSYFFSRENRHQPKVHKAVCFLSAVGNPGLMSIIVSNAERTRSRMLLCSVISRILTIDISLNKDFQTHDVSNKKLSFLLFNYYP